VDHRRHDPCRWRFETVARDRGENEVHYSAGAQRERPTFAGALLVSLEIGVEIPDETANPLLRGAMMVREGVQLMHQPLRVNPAQRVPTDVELPGVVAEHDSVAQEPMRLNTA
jgi:hypothetical protein